MKSSSCSQAIAAFLLLIGLGCDRWGRRTRDAGQRRRPRTERSGRAVGCRVLDRSGDAFSGLSGAHVAEGSAVLHLPYEFRLLVRSASRIVPTPRSSCKSASSPKSSLANGGRQEGPRWDAEIVATAAALAFNDAATTGKLHPQTRTALDRMWTVQQKDGGWNWLKCDWPPMESDDHYGVTLAAIAVGVAPDDYAETPAAQEGLVGIRRYLRDNPPPTLHHRAMLLWASSYLSDLQTDKEKAATVAELLSLQKPDGGWGLATLGDWKRTDELSQDTETSDGYGTGFVLFVLRRSGHVAVGRTAATGRRVAENAPARKREMVYPLPESGQHALHHPRRHRHGRHGTVRVRSSTGDHAII